MKKRSDVDELSSAEASSLGDVLVGEGHICALISLIAVDVSCRPSCPETTMSITMFAQKIVCSFVNEISS